MRHRSCREALFEYAPNSLPVDLAWSVYGRNGLVLVGDNAARDTVIDNLCYSAMMPGDGALALLGGHHVDIARYKGHLLAPAAGALQFQRFMLGDGLRAFKLLPALLATILVGRHGLKSSTRT
jgi:hypothetical protein